MDEEPIIPKYKVRRYRDDKIFDVWRLTLTSVGWKAEMMGTDYSVYVTGKYKNAELIEVE